MSRSLGRSAGGIVTMGTVGAGSMTSLPKRCGHWLGALVGCIISIPIIAIVAIPLKLKKPRPAVLPSRSSLTCCAAI